MWYKIVHTEQSLPLLLKCDQNLDQAESNSFLSDGELVMIWGFAQILKIPQMAPAWNFDL